MYALWDNILKFTHQMLFHNFSLIIAQCSVSIISACTHNFTPPLFTNNITLQKREKLFNRFNTAVFTNGASFYQCCVFCRLPVNLNYRGEIPFDQTRDKENAPNYKNLMRKPSTYVIHEMFHQPIQLWSNQIKRAHKRRRKKLLPGNIMYMFVTTNKMKFGLDIIKENRHQILFLPQLEELAALFIAFL